MLSSQYSPRDVLVYQFMDKEVKVQWLAESYMAGSGRAESAEDWPMQPTLHPVIIVCFWETLFLLDGTWKFHFLYSDKLILCH